MAGVLVAEEGTGGGDAPVDAEAVVEDADACVGLGMVELIALVLEDGNVAEDGEAVGEALGDEELAVVVLGELYGDMTAVGGTALADVDSDIEDGTPDTADKLGLGEGGTLEMQTPHDAVRGFALVVLDEGDRTDFLIELALREGLEEIAAGIFEEAWLDDDHTGNLCLDNVHYCSPIRVYTKPRDSSSWRS